MSRSGRVEQNELLSYNHHLQLFLTFLNQERGFADETIVNRQRSNHFGVTRVMSSVSEPLGESPTIIHSSNAVTSVPTL